MDVMYTKFGMAVKAFPAEQQAHCRLRPFLYTLKDAQNGPAWHWGFSWGRDFAQLRPHPSAASSHHAAKPRWRPHFPPSRFATEAHHTSKYAKKSNHIQTYSNNNSQFASILLTSPCLKITVPVPAPRPGSGKKSAKGHSGDAHGTRSTQVDCLEERKPLDPFLPFHP